MWPATVLPLLLLLLPVTEAGRGQASGARRYARDDFPPEFVFGAGTSAYQYEGAAAEDGRTPSIWDVFTHEGVRPAGNTGDVAADGYHKYKEDVKLMHETGLEAYRFSISWSRLIPNGRGAVNPKGLKYYNNLINELIKHGIQPHVTLLHLDIPQAIQDEYQGWLGPKFVEDFEAYADVCFREFGDRVSHWTTINEPNVVILLGYDFTLFPPRRCSPPFRFHRCSAGNSSVEPYVAMHHVLLAHAAAVHLYRTKYQAVQRGYVGINLYTFWSVPYTDSRSDREATKRSLDFLIGWILNPLVYGDYPSTMKEIAGPRLPSFTERESELVKGAFDFLGLNHYVTIYVTSSNSSDAVYRDFIADMAIRTSGYKNVTPFEAIIPVIAPPDPAGLEELLGYLKTEYRNPPVYIQENGFPTKPDSSLEDEDRIEIVGGYIGHVLNATRKGSDVRGYTVWSFVDVYEFLYEYSLSYGLYHVDFGSKNLTRTPKASAYWYKDFLKKKKKQGTNTLEVEDKRQELVASL